MHGAANPTHVDSIEQHRQLRGVHLHGTAIVGDPRSAKSTTLEPLVIENEPSAIPKQDLAPVATPPQKHEEMPCEQVHAPLSADDAAQTVMTATKIDWLDGEVDPNARRQGEQRLPQPANHRSYVRRIATFLKAQPKAATELELDLLRDCTSQPHGQQRKCLALHRGRAGRLVQVILQSGVTHAVLGRHSNARDIALLRLGYDSRPKFSATCR